MPASRTKFGLGKKFLFLLVLLVLGIVIYLNRSYAHIFDYDKARDILTADIQREYMLTGGVGTKSMKYVALGDSLTFGYGAGYYTETFPYILAKDLLKDYKEVQVVNLAVPGAITSEIITGQLSDAIDQKPQFVTVMTGTNDVHDYIDKKEFKEDLEFIVEQLKGIGAEVLVINIPYLGTKDLILPPYDFIMDAKIRDYNRIIEEVAEMKDAQYFDLYNATKEPFRDDSRKYYSLDQFHPSAAGYILWGDLINAD